MEEKERYEILNDGLIYDDNKKEYLVAPSLLRKEQMMLVCDLLNQQDKRIKELEEENKEFLQKYYNPHTKIVADISGIEVVTGVLSKSFELND